VRHSSGTPPSHSDSEVCLRCKVRVRAAWLPVYEVKRDPSIGKIEVEDADRQAYLRRYNDDPKRMGQPPGGQNKWQTVSENLGDT
jgi:hypothetical protein